MMMVMAAAVVVMMMMVVMMMIIRGFSFVSKRRLSPTNLPVLLYLFALPLTKLRGLPPPLRF